MPLIICSLCGLEKKKLAKNMCFNCYHRMYQKTWWRNRYGEEARLRAKIKSLEEVLDDIADDLKKKNA